MVNQFGIVAGESTEGAINIDVVLTGTTAVIISACTHGAFSLMISGQGEGMPVLKCDVSKKSSGDAVYIRNVMALPAVDSCALGIVWDAGEPLKIVKSLASYNGTYDVTILGPP